VSEYLEEKSWVTSENDGTYKVRTCVWSAPGDHPVGCGVIVTVKNGKLEKIEGDPEHPITNGRLCPRCLAMKEAIYHPARVVHPLLRDRKDRGKDAWQQITWDEALNIIEERTNDIKTKYGNEAIAVYTGTGRETTLYANPCAYAVLQTPHVTFAMSGFSCYGPRCAVADYILGAGYPELDYAQFLPGRYDDPRYEVPKYIIIWGKDPLHSNPDGFFGHSLIDLMKRGSKLITIDPRLTWLGVRAEYHLQLRPQTDAAVGLGLLNIVIQEELYNKEFVDQWCYGFDLLAERAAQWPPERVEEVAWVPKDKLIGAARAFANNAPGSILWGLAIDANTNGVQAGHALLDLAAICGYLDVPGGVLLTKPASFMGKWRFETAQYVPPELWEKRICPPKYKGFKFANDTTHPDSFLELIQSGEPYQQRMAWLYGTNLMACAAAQPMDWYEALAKNLEFCVVQDIFMHPTAMALGDLFLPVTMSIEHVGVVLPHFGRSTHFLGAMNQALPANDCKSDLEIDLLVGHRLNPEAWPWETPSEFFTEQIQTQHDFTFEDLQGMVVYQQGHEYRKYENGLLRADGKPGFNTATGKVELRCSMYPTLGEDALPYFEEPYYSPYSQPEMSIEYPLVLTTGGRNLHFFHSEHRQIPSLRMLTPDPLVTIHPETAKEYGIEAGDWVLIENPMGRCVQRARVTPEVAPRVVHAQHAWWFPEQDGEVPNLYGVFKANVNNLIPNHRVGRLGFGAPYKGVICKISKTNGLNG
jgi:anaerobic selenocysteine-containing dehydrogenase